MKYRINRSDTGSKALIKYAESLGFTYAHMGGAIDGLLAWGRQTVAVEWKAPGGALTPTQAKLVTKGFPIAFVSTPAQLDQLKAELIR